MVKNKCPLVMLEWEDSARPSPAWVHVQDIEQRPSIILCRSVGWLLVDNESVKVLAPNMGHTDDLENLQASGLITIPTRSVVKVHELREPS